MQTPIPTQPLRLVSWESEQLRVTTEGAAFLALFQGKRLCIVSILGSLRTGKSFLLNQIHADLFQSASEQSAQFSVAHSTEGHTRGCWVRYGGEIQQVHVLFLDTEGLDDPRVRDSGFDFKLSCLIMLVSSFVLYNGFNVITERELSNMGFLAHVLDTLGEEISKHSPHFVWMVRDFFLEFPEGITTDLQYLKAQLSPSLGRGATQRAANQNRIIFETLFPRFTCVCLPRPCPEEELHCLHLGGRVTLPFSHKLRKISRYIKTNMAPLTINEQHLDGARYLKFLEGVLECLNTHKRIRVPDLFEQVQETVFREAEAEVLGSLPQRISNPRDFRAALQKEKVQALARLKTLGSFSEERLEAFSERLDEWVKHMLTKDAVEQEDKFVVSLMSFRQQLGTGLAFLDRSDLHAIYRRAQEELLPAPPSKRAQQEWSLFEEAFQRTLQIKEQQARMEEVARELREKSQQAGEQLKELENEKRTQETAARKMKKKLERMQKANAQQNAQWEKKLSEVTEREKELMEVAVRESKQQNSYLSNQIAQLRRNLSSEEHSQSNLQRNLNSLNGQLNDLRHQLERMQRENGDLRNSKACRSCSRNAEYCGSCRRISECRSCTRSAEYCSSCRGQGSGSCNGCCTRSSALYCTSCLARALTPQPVIRFGYY